MPGPHFGMGTLVFIYSLTFMLSQAFDASAYDAEIQIMVLSKAFHREKLVTYLETYKPLKIETFI